jgi:hypothetical protein
VTVRTASTIFGLAVLAYIIVFVWFSPLLLQDLPNHLARSLIMADLLYDHGQRFGQQFQFQLLFGPYLLGDLLSATLVQTVGLAATAVIWPTLAFLSLPAALFVYLRVKQASMELMLLMLLLSLYLSTDTFFTMGFFEFKLSLALVLLASALVELLRQQWRLAYFAAFVAVVVIAYLVHLIAVAFIAAMVVASALLRRARGQSVRIDREAYLLLPVVGMLGWHLASAAAHRHAMDEVTGELRWESARKKLVRLNWDFVRYSVLLDRRQGMAFVTLILACVSERPIFWRQALGDARVLEPALYAAMFIGFYFLFPFEYSEASYVDVRALPLAALFGTLALLSIPRWSHQPAQRVSAPAIGLAAAVACVNLLYLATNFHTQDQWLRQYRAVVAKIPERAAILPVYTLPRWGNVYVELHASSFALIDRQVMIPYLFSGDRGNPMKYFRYVNHPEAPREDWYPERRDFLVDWNEVRQRYPYLLVTKPFDPSRIKLKTRTLTENNAAALLEVE